MNQNLEFETAIFFMTDGISLDIFIFYRLIYPRLMIVIPALTPLASSLLVFLYFNLELNLRRLTETKS